MEACINKRNGKLKQNNGPINGGRGPSKSQPTVRAIKQLKFDLSADQFVRELGREQSLKDAAEVLLLLDSD